jgi:hypothetical protein
MPAQSISVDIAISRYGPGTIGSRSCDLEMSPASLRNHNRDFIGLMQRVKCEVVQVARRTGSFSLGSDFLHDVLHDLRDTGVSAYLSLGDQACEILDNYEDRDRGNGLSVTVLAEVYPLLWEFVYTGSPRGQVEPHLFWGHRHRIARFLIGAEYLPEALEPRGGMLFCRNRRLAHWESEQNALKEVTSGLKFVLLDERLMRLEAEYADWELQDRILKACTAGDFGFLHMASHLYPDPEDENVLASKLALSCGENQVEINLRHLNALRRDMRFQQNPLVFLNACQTMTNPQHLMQGESFPRSFLKLGAGAVIATACDIPDIFAVAFARKFYEFFLGDQPLPASEALRQARWYFMEHHNNPLGLAYSLYAHSDLVIAW